MDLNAFDLNLLRLFEALYCERHVTRAAKRLNLTQPAASNALSRLRAAFGDDLFVRTPHGMEPTALADVLAAPIAEALEGVRAAVALSAPFDPVTASDAFILGVSDQAEATLAPRLVRRLAQAAPHLRLTLRHVGRDVAFDMLDRGDLDFAVGVLPEPPAHMTRIVLMRDRLVVLMRAGHPAAGEELTLDRFLAWPHVLVSPAASRIGAVDRLLAEQGRERRLAATVSHFLTAAEILADSDFLCTAPVIAVSRLARAFDLAIRPLPLSAKEARLSLIWHRRDERRAAHAWLRRLIADLARTAGDVS